MHANPEASGASGTTRPARPRSPARGDGPYLDGADRRFARHVLIAIGCALAAAAIVLVLATYPEVPLMLFAAVLGGVLLNWASGPLRRHGVPRSVAVVGLVLALLAAAAGIAWVYGGDIGEEATQLFSRFPHGLGALRDWLGGREWGRTLLRMDPDLVSPERLQNAATALFVGFAGAVTTAAGVLASMIVIGMLAIFLAVHPQLYTHSLLLLLPPARRGAAADLLGKMQHALQWWMIGRFTSMTVVGILTWAGLMALGVPLALLLALIAALLTFVPYVGPVLAATPALLVAFESGFTLALWTAGLYTAVQFVENHLVTPLVQQRTVSLPPAALLSAQLALGILLGFLGILLAAPLTVCVIVCIQVLYVRDVLGDDVPVMGESHAEQDGERSEGESQATAHL